MIHFEASQTINATPEAIWAVLGRYMHIDEFAPQIASVDALTSGEDGVGSKRRNHFANGTSLVEEVTKWNSGKGFTVELSDMAAMPLKKASSRVNIEPGSGSSNVTWTFDYRVKYGLLGWLMGQTMMKLMMGGIVKANLKGLEAKVLSSACG